MILAAVAPLQGEPPLERLEVVEHRLRLDGEAPAVAPDHGVPGAEVAVDRQRHLGRQRRLGWSRAPKALEERAAGPRPGSDRRRDRRGAGDPARPRRRSRHDVRRSRARVELPTFDLARCVDVVDRPVAAPTARRLRPAPIRARRTSDATRSEVVPRHRRRPRSPGRSRVVTHRHRDGPHRRLVPADVLLPAPQVTATRAPGGGGTVRRRTLPGVHATRSRRSASSGRHLWCSPRHPGRRGPPDASTDRSRSGGHAWPGRRDAPGSARS